VRVAQARSGWLWGALGAASLTLGLAGCATPPPASDEAGMAAYNEANDPIEPLNRYFFELNLGIDKLFLRPVSEIYRGVVPEIARDGVRNMLHNLDKPVILANDLLQGETDRAGYTAGSFVLNSTVGLLGFFDVTTGPDSFTGLDWPDHEEDFGQTLGVWGASEGPYLVLPLIGPAPPRDAAGRAVDSLIDPWGYLLNNEHRLGFALSRFGIAALDMRSRNIETLDEIERSSIDFYATIRSLYRQRRNAEIGNGQAGPEDAVPQLSTDTDEAPGKPAEATPADKPEKVSARTE